MREPKDSLTPMGLVIREVVAERMRQEQIWGPQNHRQIVWLGILAEEFGEAAKEINEIHFRPDQLPTGEVSLESTKEQRKRVREELIQTAAVAVAMVESLDRNGR